MVLITHWGISGPATLRLTAFAARALKAAGYRGELRLDWTGGQSQPELEFMFAEAKRGQAKRQLANWRPWPQLSRRLWLALLQGQAVDPQQRWADLTKRQQQGLITALRDTRVAVTGRGPFGEEFVTAGGIPLGEVTQKAGKRVVAFAVRGDIHPDTVVSNTFSLEWPPTSGRMAEFPEVDRADWFTPSEARTVINSAQVAFLERLEAALR